MLSKYGKCSCGAKLGSLYIVKRVRGRVRSFSRDQGTLKMFRKPGAASRSSYVYFVNLQGPEPKGKKGQGIARDSKPMEPGGSGGERPGRAKGGGRSRGQGLGQNLFGTKRNLFGHNRVPV